MLIAKFLTFAPGVGLLGLALYQFLNQRDLAAAGETTMNALAVFGFGTVLHSTHAAVK